MNGLGSRDIGEQVPWLEERLRLGRAGVHLGFRELGVLVRIFFTSALLNVTETNVGVLRMGTCSTSMPRTLGLCEDASMSTCMHTVACV